MLLSRKNEMTKVTNMNAATLIVGEELKAVKVQFTKNGIGYSYLCAHEVEVGQQVVVSGFEGKLKIVTVTEVIDALDLNLDVDYEYKLVLSTIDTAKHDHVVTIRDQLKLAIDREQRRVVLESIKERVGIKDQGILNNLLKKLKGTHE
tara:strand:- start:17362 stop:17805 length:444 start_codon:yes stop_codon:yes gene_type:complete